MAPPRHANDVIDLNFAAGANAQPALDTRIQIDRHRHMAVIQQRNPPRFKRWQPAFTDLVQIGHIPQMTGFIMRDIALWLIRDQHFTDHFTRIHGAG